MMKISIPKNVKRIITTLEANNHEAFIVGGCVRDILRHTTPTDWDITTSATPSETKALFSRTIDTGIKHGTITVLMDKTHYEVTTYRIDGEYKDNRRPESVTFTSNIEEDLSRRDFTMNAIAYNENQGFVDPFGGQEDIKNGVIRCVGNARTRFAEDALRMLRAIRFAAVTNFNVDTEIIMAIKELKQNLLQVSPERIREELGKLITAPHPQVLELLSSTGLLACVLQGREYGGCIVNTINQLKSCPPYEPMRLALFLAWAGENCENILKDLRLDSKTIKETNQYISLLPTSLPTNHYEIKKLLRILPQEWFENLLTLKAIVNPLQENELENIRQCAKDIIEKGECFNLKNLAINGKDLMKINIPPGEVMGEILEKLLDAVMQDASLNNKSTLSALVGGMFSAV